MRSQVRFVMHPDDEAAFVEVLLRDPKVVLVDNTIWQTRQPPVSRDLSHLGRHCLIWSPDDLAELPADFNPAINAWTCRAEFATIQLLRSQAVGNVITEGRLAISLDEAQLSTAAAVEQRYKLARRIIQKAYKNSVVRWRNPTLPVTPARAASAANPSPPDPSLWVGPAAMAWLADGADRRVKQDLTLHVEGMILPQLTSAHQPDQG